MKIAYLLRNRPDLEDMIPDDVEAVRIEVGEDGLYPARKTDTKCLGRAIQSNRPARVVGFTQLQQYRTCPIARDSMALDIQ